MDYKRRLQELNKDGLKKLAGRLKILGYSKMKKGELLNAIQQHSKKEIKSSLGLGFWHKYWKLFTITAGLSSIIALFLGIIFHYSSEKGNEKLNKKVDQVEQKFNKYKIEKQGEIHEIDKNLFALSIRLGSQISKLTFRFPGEGISPHDSFNFAITKRLEIIGYPHKEGEKFLYGLSGIFKRAKAQDITLGKPLSDIELNLTIEIFTELTELQKPLEKFIEKRYGLKGLAIFKLGLNVSAIRRILWQIGILEKFQDEKELPPKLADEISNLDLHKLFKPHIGILKILIASDANFFSDNLRKSINFIATANVTERSDRKKMMDQIVSIGVAYGLSLSKEPEWLIELKKQLISSYNNDISSQKKPMNMSENNLNELIKILISNKEYSEAISKLKNFLQRDPNNADAHYLLAKVRTLNSVELKQKDPNGLLKGFPSKICEELRFYINLAPKGVYVKKVETLLLILQCGNQEKWYDNPKDSKEFVGRILFEKFVIAKLEHFNW